VRENHNMIIKRVRKEAKGRFLHDRKNRELKKWEKTTSAGITKDQQNSL